MISKKILLCSLLSLWSISYSQHIAESEAERLQALKELRKSHGRPLMRDEDPLFVPDHSLEGILLINAGSFAAGFGANVTGEKFNKKRNLYCLVVVGAASIANIFLLKKTFLYDKLMVSLPVLSYAMGSFLGRSTHYLWGKLKKSK